MRKFRKRKLDMCCTIFPNKKEKEKEEEKLSMWDNCHELFAL
jgi:hypothetical protein